MNDSQFLERNPTIRVTGGPRVKSIFQQKIEQFAPETPFSGLIYGCTDDAA